MSKQNLAAQAEKIEKKYLKRDLKKKKTMKVSGAGVKRLQGLIRKKGLG